MILANCKLCKYTCKVDILYDIDWQKTFEVRYMARNCQTNYEPENHDGNNVEHGDNTSIGKS